MSGGQGKKKAKPRRRSHRPLRDLENDPLAPQTPLPKPVWDGEGWVVPPPLSSRLHQKSALGKTISGGGLRLEAIEVMFCHWHRHLPLPNKDWLEEELARNPQFIQESAILEAIRDSGEKLILAASLDEKNKQKMVSGTWGMHWARDKHPSKHPATGQVRWSTTTEKVDWLELCKWAIEVKEAGHTPEIMVIDGEFEVTSYEVNLANPEGTLRTPDQLTLEEWNVIEELIENSTSTTNGLFIRDSDNWPLKTVGIEQMNGRWLYPDEVDFLANARKNKSDSTDSLSELLGELLGRGLLLRPGFKYGCRWRIYEEEIETNHAPWLLTPVKEAAGTWEGACLASRLASAVNKTWICAIPNPEKKGLPNYSKHVFLSMERIQFG